MSHAFEKGGFARSAAWHRLGSVITAPEFIGDLPAFIREVGMAHTVEKVPAFVVDPGLDDDGNPVNIPVAVPGQYHLRRDVDGKIVSPHTVTKKYTTIQVADMSDALAPFVQNGWATVDAAFSLYDGGADLVTLRLDFGESNPEREYYAVIRNYHGRGKCSGVVTATRVVCANTEAAAFGRGANFSIAHTGNAGQKVDWAVKTWEKLREYISARVDTLNVFAETTLAVPETILGILGVDKDSSTKAKNQAMRIIEYANAPRANDTHGKTAADVYNAFTFWATHDTGGKAGKSTEGILESHLGGSRGKVEQSVVNHLATLTA